MRGEAEHILFLEIKHRASNDEDDQDNDHDRCDRGASNSLGLIESKIVSAMGRL